MSVIDFLTLLRKSRLLSVSEFDIARDIARKQQTAAQVSGATASSAESLADLLVGQSVVTRWQANQLLKGQTGFVLEQYRLLTPVGRGGMGHVFKASDSATGAIVAVKVMSRRLTGNQTLVNRFRREIRASSQLNSPHIVRTLDAGRVGKVDFMVMEYVNGDQVDRIATRLSALPISMACEIVRQAAIGLQHAHDQKMVHRDLKPGNLMIHWADDGAGIVKIMDMGLVRLSSEDEEHTSVTRAGQVMGTPDYMSPEQGWDTATVDIRSDIYSLGCSLFRLLTGRVPFPGDNPLQVLMTRCSKDAPGVRTVRSEIPEAIDAIVRRMTLKDPTARFQTPTEIVQVLTPFCRPLRFAAVQAALHDVGADDEILLEPSDAQEVTESQDAGYAQFLREMEDGAAVRLILSPVSSDEPLSSPELGLMAVPKVERASPVRRLSPKKSGAALWIGLGAGGLAVLLTALFLFVNRGDDQGDPLRPSSPVIEVPTPVLRASLLNVDPISILAGAILQFQPKFDGSSPIAPENCEVRFQLGKGAPAGVKIDPLTGAITWDIPRQQTGAAYEIPIEYVLTHGEKTNVVCSTKLVCTVEVRNSSYTFAPMRPVAGVPAEPLTFTARVAPVPDAAGAIRYRLSGDPLPEMVLDPMSGVFSWVPTDRDLGRRTVFLELFDETSSDVLASSEVTLLVRPAFALREFPEQTAVAGQPFQLSLFSPASGFPADVLQLAVEVGTPPGVVVDVGLGSLTWAVPEDASGRYEIRLGLTYRESDLIEAPDQKRVTVIAVKVAPVKKSAVPSEESVAAAEIELRDLFKREISAAKSTADRASLARQLLEKSDEQTSGASDFALLKIIFELAEKGRAVDVLLDVNRTRSVRYELPERAAALVMATDFRPGSVQAAQIDPVVEHFVRLALTSAQEQTYSEVDLLLAPPEAMLRKAERGSMAKALADDVTASRKLAQQLAEGNDIAADVKSAKLTETLQKWQFRSVLTDSNTIAYVSSGESGITDSGRSLWNFSANRIRMTTSQQPGNVGLLETTVEAGRYVLRMQLSARSTSALLIFGAGREQNLNAHVLSLDKSDFGRIVSVPDGKVISPPSTGFTVPASGWNDIELIVDGPSVSVRLNGVPVLTTRTPALKPGRLGLLIPLERAATPTVDLRRVRILTFPDSSAP